MPYVTVPRDLSKIKNKIALGLTKRQLLAIIAAGGISIPLYLLLMQPLGDLALYVAILPAVPCFLFGFYRGSDGRPLEQVLGNYIKVRYRLPRVRPYQIQNIYASLAVMQQIQEVEQEYEIKKHRHNGDRQQQD
ncbi:MAG: PrgI family protein [Angelakisella sp.]